MNKKRLLTNAIANAGMSRFHRDRLCSLKHLKSLHTFTDKSVKMCWQTVEQQFNPALAITCPDHSGTCHVKRERHPLPVSL